MQLGDGADARLYQVSSLELTRETREGSASILPRATAVLIGRPEANRVVTRPRLPNAHELLVRAQFQPQSVPVSHSRIGVLRGTEIEIGIDSESPNTGHFAVLGMSGMAKRLLPWQSVEP